MKKQLSENGARGQKFYVSYHVLPCGAGGEVGLPVPDDRYPKSYDFHSLRAKLNEILKAMVITVAAVPSTLSSKLGVTIFNLLIKEQFQLVHQLTKINEELWMEGVAGTGKTLVAVEFMRELKRREKTTKEWNPLCLWKWGHSKSSTIRIAHDNTYTSGLACFKNDEN